MRVAAVALAFTACTSEQLIDLTAQPDAGTTTSADAGQALDASCGEPPTETRFLSGGLQFSTSDAKRHPPHLVPVSGSVVDIFTIEDETPSNIIMTPTGIGGQTLFGALKPADDWALGSRLVTFVDDRQTIAFPTDRGVGTFAAPRGTMFGEPSTFNDGFVIPSTGVSEPIRLHFFSASAVGFMPTPRTLELSVASYGESRVDMRVFSEHWLSFGEDDNLRVLSFDPVLGTVHRDSALLVGCRVDHQVARLLQDTIFAAVRCHEKIQLLEQSTTTNESSMHLLACDARGLSPALEVSAAQDVAVVAFWRREVGSIELRFSNGVQVILSGYVDRPALANGVDVTFNGDRWVAAFTDFDTGFVYFEDD